MAKRKRYRRPQCCSGSCPLANAVAEAYKAHMNDLPRCPIPTKVKGRSMTLVTENDAVIWRSTHRQLFFKVESSWECTQ